MTVISILPLIVVSTLLVAVIVAFPAFNPLISPVAEQLTVDESLVEKVTSSLAFSGVTLTTNFKDSLISIVVLLATNVIFVGFTVALDFVTIRAYSPLIELSILLVALIITLPSFNVVTSPVSLIVAISTFPLSQITS